MATLKTVKIFPSIGIARIGNSPEWYVGPELPFPAPPPVPTGGTYKDAQCRIKRQAQRFRLFGYYDDNSVRELTATDGTIQWTVHLANAKAQATEGITIDPGPRTLNGANDEATFANGTYKGIEVPLGEAHTDTSGRLIVVGGFGTSASPTNAQITTFENNKGWYDDISDGSVNATITINGTAFQAVGAWVICPPPRYAPTVNTITSLYDTIRQAAILAGTLPQPGQPSFVNDILPILTRALNMRRVAALAFGPGDHDTLTAIIPPGPGQVPARQAILTKLRNPAGGGGDMPLLYGDSALKPFQYHFLDQWSQDIFTNDWPPTIPTTVTPDGMTQAALENCVGAAFFPGIEATQTTTTFAYVEPFRLDQTALKPGDVTKGMSLPWQSDFNACIGALHTDDPSWWPAARPGSVFPQGSTTAVSWTRDLVTTAPDMVQRWSQLGFIVDPGSGQLVETERVVVCKDCFIITDRSTFGKDEIDAILVQQQPAVIDSAFYVVVEGFTPSELGITTATPTDAQLQALAPAIAISPGVRDMSVHASALKVEDPSLPNQPQRFTFFYRIIFASSAGFGVELEQVTLTSTIANVSSSAQIELILQPNPYVVDGPISWLSTDLRVFQISPNGSLTGLPTVKMGNTPADASSFIKAVITGFNGHAPVNHPFDQISVDQQTSRLELSEKVNGTPIFNFAVCRVRYRAKTLDATNVRVFFRLFQTAATGTNYDLATTYRRGGQPGVSIALLGVQGGELVTIPCFAEPRVDTSTTTLNTQTDPANVQQLSHDASGDERDAYFGCWLDINQPSQNLFPIQPSPADGPFGTGRQSIQKLIRGLHQCLVAEVAFDPDPIPNGVSPAASDKLAQRNLAIVQSDNPGSPASHRIPHTFTMEPTPTTQQSTDKLDELMIDWGNTPVGSIATLYLPGVRATEVLEIAGKTFDLQTLERVDDHTLQCKTGGVTYVPLPPGVGVALAGLFTVDLPSDIHKGQVFTIVLRQVRADRVAPSPPIQITAPTRRARRVAPSVTVASQAAVIEDEFGRRVLGTFQITIPVQTKEVMLEPEERALSVLRWILESIPAENRWFLVFRRYVHQIADRVKALGGDPDQIGPSPSGDGKLPHRRHHEHEHEREREERDEHEEREDLTAFTGKIAGLVYDRFGDFEGFILDTEDGERTFASRETRIEELVRRVWAARIVVTVFAEHDDLHHPSSIILRRPPSPIES